MRLYIGNKNYSSWSLRAWLLLKQAGIPFEEIQLSLRDVEHADSAFKAEILRVNPAGRVPVLVDDAIVVWDSLAIGEYAAERFPDRGLWPVDRAARARARTLCAEMHSGFLAVRTHFPMNIELRAPEVGPRVLAAQPQAASELARLDALLTAQLTQSRGRFLFDDFTIADAHFSPIASRVRSYALPVSAATAAWIERAHRLPAMQAWVQDAIAERDFLAREELYRDAPAP
jgi:glutathione S-transferase